MPDSPSKPYSFHQTVATGLEQVERIHRFLTGTLASVLAEHGHDMAATILREKKPGSASPELGPSEVQALSFSFQMLNLAEEHTANKVRRIRESQSGARPEPGHWYSYFKKLREMGIGAGDVRQSLAALTVEPVFTKHPTEAKNWAVLALHREITQLLDEYESATTPFEKEQCALHLQAVMERLWLTGEVFSQKPEVADELDNLIFYLREVFPSVFNQLDERLRYAWKTVWPEEADLKSGELPRLRFGSWVGGDRDGHPKVTAEVTQEALLRMRKQAIRVLRKRLRKLSRGLTFGRDHLPFPEKLHQRLLDGGVDPDTRTPWRSYVQAISRQLTEMNDAGVRDALLDLEQSLLEAGAIHTVEYHVRPIMRLVNCFGLHLARLDIRQNSAFYAKALSQLMASAGVEKAEDFPNWTEEEKLSFLNEELTHSRPLAHPSVDLPHEAEETRATLTVVAKHIKSHGSTGLGALVISMTRSLSDLLTVYVLCKEVGLAHQVDGQIRCQLPVVPLFETYDDLQAAPGIVDSFLRHPVTRHSLVGTGDGPARMMIMLGYSDSNKDTGIIASQWALHRVQRELVEVGVSHGIEITFFHGRGGTVGRGAGPTHRFLEALPERALDGGLRITEQGEVIGQKYNTPTTAGANLEWLTAGSLGSRLLTRQAGEPDWLSPCMDLLGQRSRAAYRSLLEAPGFMTFYRSATPIDAIEHSRIGSRPSRRTGKATLDDLRAIPWVFSWNQSRFYLPGWFGVGTGLSALQTEEPDVFAQLKDHLQDVPFVRYILYNVESSLASSDTKLMAAYADLVEDSEVRSQFMDRILQERELTLSMLEELLGSGLPERRPRFYRTLQARERPLQLLHQQQIRLLRAFRSGDSTDPANVESLLLVINAIASGLRTTG